MTESKALDKLVEALKLIKKRCGQFYGEQFDVHEIYCIVAKAIANLKK